MRSPILLQGIKRTSRLLGFRGILFWTLKFKFEVYCCVLGAPDHLNLLCVGAQASQTRLVYVDQLAVMKERELNTLYIDFDHLVDYDQVRDHPPENYLNSNN